MLYEFSTVLSSPSCSASCVYIPLWFVLVTGKHLHVTRMQLWAENVIYFNAIMKVDQHSLSVNWLIFYALLIRSKWSFLGIKLSFMRVSMHDVCLLLPHATNWTTMEARLSEPSFSLETDGKKSQLLVFFSVLFLVFRIKCQKVLSILLHCVTIASWVSNAI